MKKLFWGLSLLVVLILCGLAYGFRDRLPFEAQLFITRYIDKPAYVVVQDKAQKIRVSDWGAFEKWLNQGILCQGDPIGDVQDASLLRRVRSLGVKDVKLESDGPPDGSWKIARPLYVQGGKVSEVTYWADSGAEFFVIVALPPETLARKMGAKKPPSYFLEQEYAVLLTQEPTVDYPRPPYVYIHPSADGQGSVLGCHWSDG